MATQPKVSSPAVADADLVARAMRKVMAREELTKAERYALKAHEKEKEERLRWQYYKSIPHRHWKQMSGRQAKVINEQAVRYGIPFAGAKIDLPAVVKGLHDFFAKNAVKLARDEDAMLRGAASPALELYRAERAALAKIDRQERERQLLPRDEVREALARIAAILKGAGDTLQRQYGPGAVEILYDAIDHAEREIEIAFGAEPMEIELTEPTEAPQRNGQVRNP